MMYAILLVALVIVIGLQGIIVGLFIADALRWKEYRGEEE